MPSTYSCTICSRKKRSHPNLSFHKFPADVRIKPLWLKACDLSEEDLKPSYKICSLHFTKESFTTSKTKRRLYITAVPTLSLEDFKKSKSVKTETIKQTLKTSVKTESNERVRRTCVKTTTNEQIPKTCVKTEPNQEVLKTYEKTEPSEQVPKTSGKTERNKRKATEKCVEIVPNKQIPKTSVKPKRKATKTYVKTEPNDRKLKDEYVKTEPNKRKAKETSVKTQRESGETSPFCPPTMFRYDNLSIDAYPTQWVCRKCLVFLLSKDSAQRHYVTCDVVPNEMDSGVEYCDENGVAISINHQQS